MHNNINANQRDKRYLPMCILFSLSDSVANRLFYDPDVKSKFDAICSPKERQITPLPPHNAETFSGADKN